MQAVENATTMMAMFGLGGAEVILLLTLIVILLGSRHLPPLGPGLRQGISKFRKAAGQVTDELDDEAYEAGRSAGGIYGKAAFQALTPNNHVAELYHPNAPNRKLPLGAKTLVRFWKWVCRLVRAVLAARDRA